jgi:hypothetical protein
MMVMAQKEYEPLEKLERRIFRMTVMRGAAFVALVIFAIAWFVS